MKYWGKEVFVGTVVENKQDGIYMQEDILCTIEGKAVFDLLNKEFYELVDLIKDQMSMPKGRPYVCGVTNITLKDCPNIALTKRGLIEQAKRLNSEWTHIGIPLHQGISRTKGRKK